MIGGPISRHAVRARRPRREPRKLEAITTDFTPPADACTTWRALYVGRKLTDDVMEHITENNILFPRFA